MKPIRILKAVFVVKIITLVALLLVVTALSLFVMLFPKSKIESIINVRAENLLQRRIDIGSISYSFRGVKLNDVRIMEPDNDNSFVSAKSIEVIFALAPILNRRLELQDLYIDNLTLFLDYRDGEYNLDRMVRSIQQSVQTGDSEGFEATIPRFHLNEALINVNNTAEDLAPLRGEYGISADIVYNENATVNIDNLSVRMPTTRGTVTGDLLLTLSDSSFEITGEADIEEVDIRWTYPFNEGEPADLPYYLINGHVNDLKITPEYTEGTVRDTTCTLINGVFVKVDSGYCRVIYEPNTLILKDVDGSANRSTFILRDLNILFDTHVDFDAQLHDVNIIDVQSMIPPIEDMPLGGNIKGTLSYDGTLYNGTVELTDAAYNPYISSVTGRITIQNNTFSKEDLHVKILGENATISAASLSRSFDNFAFNAPH
ncbi:MAG: AsmA family protein [Spirochaetota bacterium]